MDTSLDAIDALYNRANRARVPMKELCKAAKIDPSTPSRWRSGRTGPKLETLRKLEAELDKREAERNIA